VLLVLRFALPLSVCVPPTTALAASTPAFVQEDDVRVRYGNTGRVTFNDPNTAGNLIVVHVTWSNTGSVSVSDSRGNAYQSAAGPTAWGSGYRSQTFYARNIASGTNSVTATFGTSIFSFGIVSVHEYSGIDTAAPLEVVTASAGTASAMTCGPLVTTNATDLLFVAGESNNWAAAGSGYTVRSSSYSNFTGDFNVTAAGAYSATATQWGGAWAMQMVAFKAAGSAAPDTKAPTVPANLTASAASATQVNLSWSASTDNIGVAGYKVFRNSSSIATTTATTYADTGLSAGTAYTYTVSAYDAAGNSSAPSASATATTFVLVSSLACSPSSLGSGAASACTVTVSKAAPSSGVVVVLSSSSSALSIPVSVTVPSGATSASFSATAGTVSTAQTATVSASYGSSYASANIRLVVSGTDTQAPSAPTGLVAAGITWNSATISWTAASDNVAVTGYQVFRNGAQISSTTGTSYSDSGLTASTTYSYYVTASDAAGNVSTPSTALSVTSAAAPAGPVYPLKVGPTGRYLVDQSGTPFMIVGDAPHSLLANVSTADAETYFANRQARGFNSVWIELLCNTYTGGRSNGSTYDGIVPFTTAGDFSTPNSAYFQRVDAMITLAAAHNLTVFLDPVDLTGWIATLRSNGTTKAYNFGLYLGNRYKAFPNIVWMNGNDFQTWSDATDDADALALANGIKAADPNHIQSVELDYPVSSSLDDPNWASVIQLNAVYTYRPTYAEVLSAYNQSSSMPVFMVEATYEMESPEGNTGDPQTLRRQEYWTMLSGATGQLYGNHYTWTFASGWKNNLNTTGVTELEYVTALLAPRAWYKLVPDQQHVFVISGLGTYSSTGTIAANDYVTAAITPDGTLGLAYLPTVRTVTVNLSKMSGTVTARWYDPTRGSYTAIAGSPFANTGTWNFTPTGNNAGGAGDWVLVLEGSTDITPPSAPSNLTATGGIGAAVLNWSAATDNAGVTAYNIHRATVSGFIRSSANRIGQTSALTYTDAAAAGTYYYVVTAQDAAGNTSAASGEASATISADTQAPSVPTGLSASAAAGKMSLSWTASTDDSGVVAGYHVFRDGSLIGSTSATGYADTTVVSSTTYSYTVTAYDGAGNTSAASSPVSAKAAPAVPVVPAFVQQTSKNVTSGKTNSVTFPSANTAGNLIVVYVNWGNTGTVSISDSRGNTYQSAVGPTSWSTSYRAQVFYARNIAAGTNTITATFGTTISSFGIVYIHEYSGIDTTAPLDVAVAGTGTSSALVSGSATTTNATDLLFAAGSSSNTVTASGSGYTARSFAFGNITEDRNVTATGAYSATATHNGTAWVMQLAAFKAALK
jgi:chitodextrinase